MKEIGTIITENRKLKGLSQKELAEQLTAYGHEITYKAISKWEKHVALPSVPILLSICKILEIPDIYEAYWGKNPFHPFSELNEDGIQKAKDYIEVLAETERYRRTEAIIIPFKRTIRLFNIPASAGTGEFLDSDDYEMLEVGTEVPEDADFGIRIAGNSMEPRFVNGQIVWIRKQEYLSNGEIGIFYLDGNSYCKKLQDDENGIFLISLNKDYAPIPIEPHNTFKIFGKVVG